MNSEEKKKNGESIESSRIVSDRGQTVIPKPIRDYMDIQAGDKLVWTVNEQGAVMVQPVKRKSVMELKGIVMKKLAMEDLEQELSSAKEQHYSRRNESGREQDA